MGTSVKSFDDFPKIDKGELNPLPVGIDRKSTVICRNEVWNLVFVIDKAHTSFAFALLG